MISSANEASAWAEDHQLNVRSELWNKSKAHYISATFFQFLLLMFTFKPFYSHKNRQIWVFTAFLWAWKHSNRRVCAVIKPESDFLQTELLITLVWACALIPHPADFSWGGGCWRCEHKAAEKMLQGPEWRCFFFYWRKRGVWFGVWRHDSFLLLPPHRLRQTQCRPSPADYSFQ